MDWRTNKGMAEMIHVELTLTTVPDHVELIGVERQIVRLLKELGVRVDSIVEWTPGNE